MSGWDEGQVHFQNIGLDPEGEDGGGESRHSVQSKLREFLRSFSDPTSLQPFYKETIQQAPRALTVHWEHLRAYEEDLAHKLKENPAQYLPLLEAAAAEVLASLRSTERDAEDGLEVQRRDIQITLSDQGHPTTVRTLSAKDISKLVKVPGIVIAASRVKAKATTLQLICKQCRATKTINCKPGFGGALIPRSCDRTPEVGEDPCPLDPWLVMPDKSRYVDQQTLKLQENPEDVPVGEMPRSLLLAVDRTLVHRIVPGTRITVLGIYSIFHQGGGSRGRSATAIRQPYLHVVGISMQNEGGMRGEPTFSPEEETEMKEFAAQPDVIDQITARIAPSIFGSEDVKKAVACLLFGGSRKLLPDGVRLRGDINVLLLGDPSTAKSQFLKFVEKTAPVAVYTSGKGSSAAGLTASVIKDPGSGEFYLEGGAMVLADGGVVCIDEFDKMRPEDRVAIHEAMEQQTISIAKAGITTVLNSRTAVLAAANPPSGRYDDLKSTAENIDLQTTILSRFDLIFIVKDERNHERDMQIARHVLGVHATAEAKNQAAESSNAESENFLKRYVEYCRHRCSPRLTDVSAEQLKAEYVRIRQDMRQKKAESKESAAIPITVRQLEAVVRISESLAKMQCQREASAVHVKEALRLFNVSTIDAATAGVALNANALTPEQAAEVRTIEEHVKREMPIHSSMAERKLIGTCMTLGLSESAVRKALLVMCQRNELEYRRERRSVYRLA